MEEKPNALWLMIKNNGHGWPFDNLASLRSRGLRITKNEISNSGEQAMSFLKKLFGGGKKKPLAARYLLKDLIPGGMPLGELLVRTGDGKRMMGCGGKDDEFIRKIVNATRYSAKAADGIALLYALMRNHDGDAEYIISQLRLLAEEGETTERGVNAVCALVSLRAHPFDSSTLRARIANIGLGRRFEVGVRTRALIELHDMRFEDSDLYKPITGPS